MFCPKCKYTTFDFYKNCPKCNFDWDSIRKDLGLEWMMEPDIVKATELPEEEMEMEVDIPSPKEEIEEKIEVETTGDISIQEKEEEIELKLDSSLMVDNEEKESPNPEFIEPEIEITQEPEIDVIPMEKEEKHESEVWDIEFEDGEKDKKIESNRPKTEKDTEPVIPEIDLKILLDEEEKKESKN